MLVEESYSDIIALLPYRAPFLFVDSLEKVTEEGVIGHYIFHPDADYYRGHFKDQPVTPGVLLTECMAQIGLVCLGLYLLKDHWATLKKNNSLLLGFSESQVHFLLPVWPGEKVRVESEKVYFRFNKLKCKVRMYNQNNELVSYGELSGMIQHKGT